MNEQVIIQNNSELRQKVALIDLLIDKDFAAQPGYLKATRENRRMLYIIFNYQGSYEEIVVELARQIEQKLHELISLTTKNRSRYEKES